jgi:hypothetical protein
VYDVQQAADYNGQCDAESLSLSLLDPPDLLPALGVGVLLVARVPVDILVLLPSTGGGVDRVAEVVFPVLVCGDVWPLEFGLATAGAASDGLVVEHLYFKGRPHVESWTCSRVCRSGEKWSERAELAFSFSSDTPTLTPPNAMAPPPPLLLWLSVLMMVMMMTMTMNTAMAQLVTTTVYVLDVDVCVEWRWLAGHRNGQTLVESISTDLQGTIHTSIVFVSLTWIYIRMFTDGPSIIRSTVTPPPPLPTTAVPQQGPVGVPESTPTGSSPIAYVYTTVVNGRTTVIQAEFTPSFDTKVVTPSLSTTGSILNYSQWASIYGTASLQNDGGRRSSGKTVVCVALTVWMGLMIGLGIVVV